MPSDHFRRLWYQALKLARSLPPQEIALRACRLYEEFHPQIPAGVRGWGAEGKLDLDRIEALAEIGRVID
jgi:hypothetical protein